MVNNNLHLIKLIFACVLIAMLAACAGKPSTKYPSASESSGTKREKHAQAEVEAQVQQLELATQLIQQGENRAGLNIFEQLDINLLPKQYFWQALQTSVATSLVENNGWLALKNLEKFSQGLTEFSREEYFILFQFKADALMLTGSYEEALEQRFNQAKAATNKKDQAASYDQLWTDLLQLDNRTLTRVYIQSRQAEPKGWYELALVRQSLANNPDDFAPKWEQWHNKWPNHTAQKFMPEEMPRLVKLSSVKITHLGVFLPQEGSLKSASKAIQNALVAAQLNAIQHKQNAPKLSFFNSHNKNLDQLYAEAKAAGVEVIIGPLAKGQVTALENRSNPKLPTLALNYGSSTNKVQAKSNLFQLGLSAENEAENLAEKAWRSGFRHALVLTPNDSWGNRVKDSFIEAWEALGGEVDLTRQFGQGKSLDKALRELLEVELSQQRHQKITRLLGQRPHFTPHAREDSDFLFVHANPDTARQIKPALKFLNSGSLPVLATSSVYAGQVNPSLDKDMDGIIFSDIPWYLTTASSQLNALQAAWPNSMQSYGRLFALGEDAYFLAQRLHLLAAIPKASFAGATGVLSQEKGVFKRELAWAEFSQGKAKYLPASSLEAKFLAPEKDAQP